MPHTFVFLVVHVQCHQFLSLPHHLPCLYLPSASPLILPPSPPSSPHSTRVAASCSSTSYQPATHRRLTIGVYGYAAASFALLVAAAGDIAQLPR